MSRSGRGPGELAAPEALESIGDTLVVVDRSNVVKWLSVREGDVVELRSVPLDFVPEDLCVIRGRVFVHGHRSRGGVLHEVSSDGSVRSFAAGYVSTSPLVRQQLSDARIGCVSSERIIVYAFEWFPWLQGFADSATRRWVSSFGDFEQADVESSSDARGPWVEQSGESFDIVGRIVPLNERYLLVQVDHRTLASRRQRRAFAYTSTYVVDGATGEGGFATDELPAILAIRGTTAIAAVNDSIPQVILLTLPADR
jgi:hypothetical protein